MKVTAPERVFLVALDDWVEGAIDVPDELGEQLVAQGWEPTKAKTARPKAEPTNPPAAAEQED